MSYAVIETGSKQYRVQEGDVIRVEKLEGSPGDTIEFDSVLMLREKDVVASPSSLKGAKVRGEILGHGRGKKIIIFKFKKRKNYRRKKGHRQDYTAVKITGIEGMGGAAS